MCLGLNIFNDFKYSQCSEIVVLFGNIYVMIIEFIQFHFVLGNFDITNILFNIIGFCIGIGGG